MFDASRRPMRRLFCLPAAMIVGGAIVISAFGFAASGDRRPNLPPAAVAAGHRPTTLGGRRALAAPAPATPVPQTGPATTTVSDTVYRADGAPTQGTLIITWPAFATATGTAVAAGATNVTLGTNGALSVGLVPNAGASPAGVYYTVVYQLGPAEVRTEYWLVPTSSPANLATVRTTPGTGTASQPVSMQYVNTALSTKANDTAVVHLNGSETISGTKTFATAPSVPAPTSTGQAANKAYVDTSVANVGAGNFLPTAGGTMTGALTLSGNPTAPLQAVAASSSNLMGQWDFYFCERIPLRFFRGESRWLLQHRDCTDCTEQCAGDQHQWEVVADVSALAGELVRSVRRVCTGHKRSPGFREHGSRLDDPTRDTAAWILCQRERTRAGDIKIYNTKGLFGNKSGAEKKDAAMSFLQNALAMTDAIAAREIIEPESLKKESPKLSMALCSA